MTMERCILPPGFRFHPTDEELVSHYLRRKVCGRSFHFNAIGEIDLYKFEPWDLPERSIIQTRDKEWYFFIPRDRKYANGSRTNRATEKGYWKSTGKDRCVSSNSRAVGTKKTLVYYIGRAPKGKRTDWVMHEYRLNDTECERIHAQENGFVLCRIYEKGGPGPRNGEQYGAPVEDEDNDDESPIIMGEGSGSFMSKLSHGASSNITVQSPTSEEYQASRAVDISSSTLLPCNLEGQFDLFPNHGEVDMQFNIEPFLQGSPLPLSYELVQSEVGSADQREVEHKLIEELYSIVASTTSTNHKEFADASQGVCTSPLGDRHQDGENHPQDGDYLELDDLISISDSEEYRDIEKSTEKRVAAQGCSFQAPSMLDNDHKWEFQMLVDQGHEQQQTISENDFEQSSFSTVTGGSGWRDHNHNFQQASLPIGPAGQTDIVEPANNEVWKVFEQMDQLIKNNKSVNVEDLAKFIDGSVSQPEHSSTMCLQQSEESCAVALQDGHYYDTALCFTADDLSPEGMISELQASCDHETLEMILSQATLGSNADEPAQKLAHPNGALHLEDLVTENNCSVQVEAVTLEQQRQPQSQLSLFLSWLNSLPTLPASAADLSPKGDSPQRPISLTATGVDVGSVTVSCKCVAEGISSSCVICSVGEVQDTNQKQSFKHLQQRVKPSRRLHVGYFTSAIFVAFWAVFWMLVIGGTWKIFSGISKLLW
ncbi:hypothetical protein KP509_02G064600 [Ceratopteris richardii]|uniref:NAC domain-containing protein n=1 Tax=Ceratopteris richardii TaxID=49495 RepID=A0A8T2VI13_CERRI|nr:hypothetical protein KP509_02G064600 [Ceratopteris richardii]KAH7444098.1 hypothetical protein KP509_02G064600 [Ceratopteris richardii]KAH7444099.1 hypothetical protein KP509_02G064600 [Ceratopteris richardii]KAH7444102.1 hypothetical protein KP509_02G064600 [Ceratopteris richardii]KAH7444103.1 hypothetical protein KP509_02G064600 [Ceratopteris richardii]